ncbi:MAG: NADP-dependent isocitrate dehydrogenase [Chloroflexi bacterium]|nr:NADP-dependent isocitrate dehydrogenase [Chloroflexota bacterium]
MEKQRITVARGDGIGPEIMQATLDILQAAGAPLEYDEIEIGEKVYERGVLSGIPAEAWETVQRNRVLLKAPITTPQGGGYKSINVTLRKALGLFANVRPSKAYVPYVPSHYPGMDLVMVRENEEDLYAGIEHQQTREVTQTLKLISRPGSEGIIRYAFEYARAYGRKKVTCMSKDNIMKQTDGLFHKVFDEVAVDYPDIQAEHMIVDIGAARVAARPDTLDVVVTTNLYGDILSDVAALVAGSVGLAGSANVGREAAMFEAIHGSAPRMAGRGVANPSGLLQGAVMMLVHLGLAETAEKVHNAWLRALEDGMHTKDIFREGFSREQVSTAGFAEAVIARLGQLPQQLAPVHFKPTGIQVSLSPTPAVKKQLVGVDVFLDWSEAGRDPETLGRRLAACGGDLPLKMVSNRGIKVYPGGQPGIFLSDHWRARFGGDGPTGAEAVLALLGRVNAAGLEIIKTENLYTFDGEAGYSAELGE